MLLQLPAAVLQLPQAKNIVAESILSIWTIGSPSAVLLTLALSDRGSSQSSGSLPVVWGQQVVHEPLRGGPRGLRGKKR